LRINNFKLSEHFNLMEFQCPCCHTARVHPRLVRMLESLRDKWGDPIFLTSGYRCISHNREVGGVPDSLHILGQAADVVVFGPGQSLFVQLARKEGFTSVIPNYERNYVHLGIRNL